MLILSSVVVMLFLLSSRRRHTRFDCGVQTCALPIYGLWVRILLTASPKPLVIQKTRFLRASALPPFNFKIFVPKDRQGSLRFRISPVRDQVLPLDRKSVV